MSGISTHILNTATGRPAGGVEVRLFAGDREINATFTNADGRCLNLLPTGMPLKAGVYRIVFAVRSIFPDGFYPEVSISIEVRDPASHYHVPLLMSPFGYTTYRGS